MTNPTDRGVSTRVRKSHSERSQRTRGKLLQAAIDVLLERGYAGLTTAQVDARAGVSGGARIHHYPTKADLVVAATSYAYECAMELGQQRADAARRSAEPVRDLLADCRSIYFGWPFLAATEILVTARTDAALMGKIQPVLDRFHAGMKATWLDALIAAGFAPLRAETVFALTLNLIRGMALNKMWQQDSQNYDRLLETWCQYCAKDGGANVSLLAADTSRIALGC